MSSRPEAHPTRLFIGTALTIVLLDELVSAMMHAIWPTLQLELDLGVAEVGALLGVPTLVAGVAEPLIGLAGDRWRVSVRACGGVAFSAALFLFATAHTYAALLLAMTLFYSASGALLGLTQATLVESADDLRGRERRMSWWNTLGWVGMLVGPLIIASALHSWRTAFLASAAACLALTLIQLRDARRESPAREAEPEEEDAIGTLERLREAARQPRLRRALVRLALSDIFAENVFLFTPLLLVARGHSATLGAIALTVMGISGLLGSAALLPILKRIPGEHVIRLSALLTLPLYIAALLTESATLAIALLTIIAALTATWYPLLKAELFDTLPDHGGTVMALDSVSGTLTGLLPIALGLVAEATHLHVALALLIPALLPLIRRDSQHTMPNGRSRQTPPPDL